MNRLIAVERPRQISRPAWEQSHLIFHPAEPGQTILDPRTSNMLRLDGWWKTPDGRVILVALSAPASILRLPQEISRV